MKSNLRTSIYCKMRLVVCMVQDGLRKKSTGIIQNELIMQWVNSMTVTGYCLSYKFESIGQLISVVYTEV